MKAAIFQPHLANAQLFITENYADWVHRHNKLKPACDHYWSQSHEPDCRHPDPPGIIAAVPFAPVNGKEAAHAAHSERAVYLHEIQDPGNLGTILRTLGWFGGFRCLLSPGSVDPYNPESGARQHGSDFSRTVRAECPAGYGAGTLPAHRLPGYAGQSAARKQLSIITTAMCSATKPVAYRASSWMS